MHFSLRQVWLEGEKKPQEPFLPVDRLKFPNLELVDSALVRKAPGNWIQSSVLFVPTWTFSFFHLPPDLLSILLRFFKTSQTAPSLFNL